MARVVTIYSRLNSLIDNNYRCSCWQLIKTYVSLIFTTNEMKTELIRSCNPRLLCWRFAAYEGNPKVLVISLFIFFPWLFQQINPIDVHLCRLPVTIAQTTQYFTRLWNWKIIGLNTKITIKIYENKINDMKTTASNLLVGTE